MPDSEVITPQTRFRKFNFTLYEGLDTFVSRMKRLFKRKDNPFKYMIFQMEVNHNPSDPNRGRKHAQGYAEIDQMRLGWYNDRKKTDIKKLFQANVHVEHANGTREECVGYCKKKYNRCKLPEHNEDPKHGKCCKCSFQDLSLHCRLCNDECVRTLARVSEDMEESGPFEFVRKEKGKDQEKEDEAISKAVDEVLDGQDPDEVIL